MIYLTIRTLSWCRKMPIQHHNKQQNLGSESTGMREKRLEIWKIYKFRICCASAVEVKGFIQKYKSVQVCSHQVCKVRCSISYVGGVGTNYDDVEKYNITLVAFTSANSTV